VASRIGNRVDGLPRLLLVPAGLALLVLLAPIVALFIRTPWDSFLERLTSPILREALGLSLFTSLIAALLCVVLGVPLALYLANGRGRTRAVIRALVIVPLVLPPVVGGVALLAAFGRTGVLGRPAYEATGLSLPFSTAGVVLSQLFVALPFMVLATEGALRIQGREYQYAAATLQATPWQTLTRVTLPIAWAGIGAGLVLSWARALGEFGATITFAGSIPGRTQTVPLAVYASLDVDQGDAIALSIVMIVVSVLILVLGKNYWLRGLR
jgi:molybdate transport system permease protein